MTIEKSRALYDRAVELMPGGVSSPVRAFRSVGGSPLFMKKGEGPFLVDEDDNRRAVELLAGFEVSIDQPFAVIAFRAVAESRRWGDANYTELSRLLTARFGWNVLLVGSSHDVRTGEQIAAAVGEQAGPACAVNLAGKTSLRELAAVCSRAKVFVGNDSGPAHLAAASGAPIVVLSGADDPHETSPISSQKRLVFHAELDCISCVKNKCPLKGEHFMQCMKRITVGEVLDQIEGLTKSG